MNYGGPFIYPPISFPIPLSLFLRLLDILCPSQTLLPPFLPLCAIYLVRVPPIQARLSVQLREVAEASSWPNCSATYSARMHVLWVHVSVNFGNRYLDGLFAIFHYACGQCVCVRARASKRSNDYERCGRERGRRMEYIYLVTSFVARNLGNLIIGGRLPSLSNCERVRTLIINLIINA